MKVKKRTFLFFISLFVSVSMYLISTDLVAMSPDVRERTYVAVFINQPSPQLLDDWVAGVWRRTPEVEIVNEHKETVLKVRSHQFSVALYEKAQVDFPEHPNWPGNGK